MQVVYTLPQGPNPADALVSECGSMNLFFLLAPPGGRGGPELVTPPLDGTILPGVTRDSILKLAGRWVGPGKAPGGGGG
jgi:branched-subunit amino acid aminotransferase/4-amino-4-deoxychorismate lyase